MHFPITLAHCRLAIILAVGGVFIAVACVAVFLFVSPLWTFRFESQTEFVDLPGDEAKAQFGSAWPDGIDPAAVTSFSYSSNTARDSFSSWYRIVLGRDDAQFWMVDEHASQERRCGDLCEGLRREVTGPPPLHWQTGETPSWWTPPSIEFRATEIMLWYGGCESGVGRATYSAFDETTGTLWMYDYASQHDLLWEPCEMPEGDAFATIAPESILKTH